MNDPLTMGMIERVGHLDGVIQHLTQWKRSSRQPLRDRLAIEIFHDKVRKAVLVSHIVDDTNVRVVEGRNRLRLPLETLPTTRMIGQFWRQDLEGDESIETGVPRVIHLAHASGP